MINHFRGKLGTFAGSRVSDRQMLCHARRLRCINLRNGVFQQWIDRDHRAQRQMRTFMALTTLSLTSRMRKQCQRLNCFTLTGLICMGNGPGIVSDVLLNHDALIGTWRRASVWSWKTDIASSSGQGIRRQVISIMTARRNGVLWQRCPELQLVSR